MKSIVLCIILFIQIGTIAYGQRPMYIIYPKIEKVEHIDTAIKGGANSLLSRINFDSDGTPQTVGVSWTNKENIDVYLEGLRNRVNPESKYYLQRLAIQIFEVDLGKLSSDAKKIAAKKLYDSFSKSGIVKKDIADFYVIILMSNTADTRFMEDFLDLPSSSEVRIDKIGWGLKNGDPKENSGLLKHFLKKETRIWQAAMTGALNPSVPHDQLEAAIKIRKEGGIAKVITGKVSRDATLKELLTYNIDGIVTREVNSLNDLIQKEKAKYRLPKAGDNPFTPIN